MDNNQRDHPLKYQRFGSSNSLVKVTCRKCYKCLICEVIIRNEDKKRCPLVYIDQLTVNLINFSIFDKEITAWSRVGDIKQCLLIMNRYSRTAVKIDMTGSRVMVYRKLVSIAKTICKTIMTLLPVFNLKRMRPWRN